MTRDEVERTINRARTPEQLDAAVELGREWLRDHPDDKLFIGMLMEGVEMIRSAAARMR